MKPWILYVLPPIDFKWEFLLTLREAIAKCDIIDHVSEISSGWVRASALLDDGDEVRCPHWDGERFDPLKSVNVFFFPADTEMDFGFVYKQSDNGTTFVFTQTPTPHLEQLCTDMYTTPGDFE